MIVNNNEYKYISKYMWNICEIDVKYTSKYQYTNINVQK